MSKTKVRQVRRDFAGNLHRTDEIWEVFSDLPSVCSLQLRFFAAGIQHVFFPGACSLNTLGRSVAVAP